MASPPRAPRPPDSRRGRLPRLVDPPPQPGRLLLRRQGGDRQQSGGDRGASARGRVRARLLAPPGGRWPLPPARHPPAADGPRARGPTAPTDLPLDQRLAPRAHRRTPGGRLESNQPDAPAALSLVRARGARGAPGLRRRRGLDLRKDLARLGPGCSGRNARDRSGGAKPGGHGCVLPRIRTESVREGGRRGRRGPAPDQRGGPHGSNGARPGSSGSTPLGDRGVGSSDRRLRRRACVGSRRSAPVVPFGAPRAPRTPRARLDRAGGLDAHSSSSSSSSGARHPRRCPRARSRPRRPGLRSSWGHRPPRRGAHDLDGSICDGRAPRTRLDPRVRRAAGADRPGR